MAKNLSGGKNVSPEEHGSHKGAKRGGFGNKAPNLTGPTPYSKSQSKAPAPLSAHEGTSGRGGQGKFGKGDGFKTRAEDVEHPQSHAEFESLGTD